MTLKELLMGAGAGVWPTLLFGFSALGLSAAHALRPRANWTPLILGTGAATLLSGALAFVAGCVWCFNAVVRASPTLPLPDASTIALAGVAESLGNLEIAFGLTALVALLAGIGSFRAQRQIPAAA
jgi:hypothetical protein